MSGLKQMAWTTSRLIAQNGGLFSRALYEAANLYRRSFNNLNYDMNTNGEYHVLDKLAATGVKTVLDVGANKGEYISACLSRFEAAQIHAFEIAPQTFAKLKANIASDRVKLNNIGLSDREGSFTLSYNPESDGLSSLVEGRKIHDGAWQSMEVHVITGDQYCRDNAIDTIDFLKVDVEGAENLVFSGFAEMFERQAVSALQFEFGMVNIYSRFLLRDFYELFEAHGFVLGPVMPRGVLFKGYNVRDEDFQGPPNFFAVHKSKPRIIDAVRVR